MKRVALTLAAFVALGLMVNASLAGDGALSYPMAAHVAAKYGVQHSGHNPVIQQVHHRYQGHQSYRPQRGRVIVHPPVYRYPVVVPRYVHPPVYRVPQYYSYPQRGFNYYGPGFSIGFGF